MGELNNYLVFDGIDSSTYGVYISGEGVFNAPNRRGETVTIPGRNGNLFIDGGSYENITVTYPAFMAATDSDTFAANLASFRAELASRTGYLRLEDSYNDDEYRLAIFRSGFETNPMHYNRAGEFEIVFDCKPQRFLTSGETAVSITSGDTLTNPTLFEALPLIEVEGIGTVVVGSTTITITGDDATQVVYIDSDLYDAYISSNGSIDSANDLVSFTDNKFPVLSAGTTTVTFSDVTAVSIKPRWWTL